MDQRNIQEDDFGYTLIDKKIYPYKFLSRKWFEYQILSVNVSNIVLIISLLVITNQANNKLQEVSSSQSKLDDLILKISAAEGTLVNMTNNISYLTQIITESQKSLSVDEQIIQQLTINVSLLNITLSRKNTELNLLMSDINVTETKANKLLYSIREYNNSLINSMINFRESISSNSTSQYNDTNVRIQDGNILLSTFRIPSNSMVLGYMMFNVKNDGVGDAGLECWVSLSNNTNDQAFREHIIGVGSAYLCNAEHCSSATISMPYVVHTNGITDISLICQAAYSPCIFVNDPYLNHTFINRFNYWKVV